MQTEILERGTKKDFSRMFDPKNGTHFEKYFFQNPTSFGPKDVEKPKKFYLKKSPLFLHAFSKIA